MNSFESIFLAFYVIFSWFMEVHPVSRNSRHRIPGCCPTAGEPTGFVAVLAVSRVFGNVPGHRFAIFPPAAISSQGPGTFDVVGPFLSSGQRVRFLQDRVPADGHGVHVNGRGHSKGMDLSARGWNLHRWIYLASHLVINIWGPGPSFQ